jgi:hypothetical protein
MIVVNENILQEAEKYGSYIFPGTARHIVLDTRTALGSVQCRGAKRVGRQVWEAKTEKPALPPALKRQRFAAVSKLDHCSKQAGSSPPAFYWL